MEASDQRQHLKLLLVASRHHLSSGDLRSLIQFLESDDCGFEVALQVADPTTIRNCLSCTGWWSPRH